MKILSVPGLTIGLMSLFFVGWGCTSASPGETDSLKDAFAGKFYIGAAMNAQQITGRDTAAVRLLTTQFNSVVAENCMKSGPLQPVEGQFDFALADQFVDFAEQHGMHVVGHTLIWHSQAPRWFFVDGEGNDVSREVLIERMRTHINTVVGRYKGRVHGWDVVNEAIVDDGSWRQSKFYQILGEEFVQLAFEMAHAADPDAELYYNDYSMALPGRRQGVVNMVKSLQEKGVKIDGIGMQGHVQLDHPSIEDFEKSILAFAELGVHVMITEMDITVLPSPWELMGADVNISVESNPELNPYADGLPDDQYQKLHNRYLEFFNLFIKHSDKISRVTTWGVDDGQSWKNNWPIRGRTDYTLLFDRNYEPKPVVGALIESARGAK
jgi:endo-1,4-beta-xylanase